MPHRIIRSWYSGRWWVDCYIWYSEEGLGRAATPASRLLAVPNVTAHPSTASVPITVLLYDSSLLCGFNSGGSRPGPGGARPPLFVQPPQFLHRLLIIATDDTMFTWRSGARPPPRCFGVEPPLGFNVAIKGLRSCSEW